MSEHSDDYKTRAETTYLLQVERQGDVSDQMTETRVETTYSLEVERETRQMAAENTKQGQ